MKAKLQTLVAALVMLATCSFAAQAQTSVTSVAAVSETEEFNPHFFIQPQFGGAYTLGEASFGKLTSFAAAFYGGYRFSPVFGVRLGVSGWNAKGSWTNPRHYYSFNYVQPNVDAMLSFTNLFMGYNPKRVLDVYGFLGVGAPYAFHNDDVEKLVAEGYTFQKAWCGHRWFVAGRVGVGMNVNLSRVVALNFEVNTNIMNDHFNSKKGSSADWQYNALVGLTVSFGRTKKIVEAVEETIVEEPAPAPAPEPAPEPKKEVAPAPKPAPAPATITENIFFRINTYNIAAKEQYKIDELVKFLKANPDAKVVVTGYADKDTGTAAYNRKLSRLRAMKVADALDNAGIAASRIDVQYKGDTVQPFVENDQNRVAIAIAK